MTSRRSIRRGIRALTVSTTVALSTTLVTAGSAQAAWAYHTGYHTSCADSLTFHSTDSNWRPNGQVRTLTRGTELSIEKFSSSGGTAYVIIGFDSWGNDEHGTVLNGYFC